MSSIDPSMVLAILPEIGLVILALIVLAFDLSVGEDRKRALGWLTAGGLAVIFILNLALARPGTSSVPVWGGMLHWDWLGFTFANLFIFGAAVTSLFAMEVKQLGRRGEFYLLLLASTLGMCLMAASADLIMLFLAIETTSIPLYVLAGFYKTDNKSTEAGFKYLLFGALTSAVMLYGFSLLYGFTGTTDLYQITAAAQSGALPLSLALGTLILVLVGFGFKISAVPFHFWAPDVYEGAPSPITAFMSVGVKAAAFAALLRVFSGSLAGLDAHWRELLWLGSVLTMTLGNVTALLQNNIKRMLAYSSIAHAGYILIGVVAGGEMGTAAVLYYLLVYTLMNIGAFAVVIAIEKKDDQQLNIRDYAGIGSRHPALGVAMAIFMFSLAGIPPLSGFMGKFYIFSAAVKAGYIGLTIIGVLNSLISVYYYLRITVMMFMTEPEGEPAAVIFQPAVIIVLVIAVFFTLQMGLFPATYLQLAKSSIKLFL